MTKFSLEAVYIRRLAAVTAGGPKVSPASGVTDREGLPVNLDSAALLTPTTMSE